ncbi:SH3 domain-containing protein [Pseudothioclava arenosa]|nr:SH3 domain-containing protein [Pseudothioclava arenosa]
MAQGRMLGQMVIGTLACCFLILSLAGNEEASANATPAPQAQPAVAIAAPAPPALPEGARITPLLVKTSAPAPVLRPSPEHRAIQHSTPATTALWQVTANRLNLRAAASAEAPVLDRLSLGAEVLPVSATDAEWVRVRIQGTSTEGWVATRLLRPIL